MPRISMFARTLIWFFLNLVVLATVLLLIFGINLRFDPGSRFFGGTENRIETVSRLISSDLDLQSKDQRDDVLFRYSQAYGVDFLLFDDTGKQLAGKSVVLPDEVRQSLTENPIPRRPSANEEMRPPRSLPPPGAIGPFGRGRITTEYPTQYWMVIRTMFFDQEGGEPIRCRLVIRSDSYYGYGLFFDPRPWIAIGLLIVIISVLFWLPFVRSLTRSIDKMKDAAKRIADEDFSVRVNDRRTDELGSLGHSINDMAERLEGFVKGQRRFLGDISHELNSPLARMQFALSILEEKTDAAAQSSITDVREEVDLMTKLVNELLSYSKTGIQGASIELAPVSLLSAVGSAIRRESAKKSDAIDIEVAIPDDITVFAQQELLVRAISNILRNALLYASKKITITAKVSDGEAVLIIADDGSGVPDEMLEKIFDPLFRVQNDRSRSTGGTGLGLAIVRTCFDACGGRVHAQNVSPHGLAVVCDLNVAHNDA